MKDYIADAFDSNPHAASLAYEIASEFNLRHFGQEAWRGRFRDAYNVLAYTRFSFQDLADEQAARWAKGKRQWESSTCSRA